MEVIWRMISIAHKVGYLVQQLVIGETATFVCISAVLGMSHPEDQSPPSNLKWHLLSFAHRAYVGPTDSTSSRRHFFAYKSDRENLLSPLQGSF